MPTEPDFSMLSHPAGSVSHTEPVTKAEGRQQAGGQMTMVFRMFFEGILVNISV